MTDRLRLPAEREPVVDAVLEGGPRTLGPERRAPRVAAGAEKIKVPHCGGYEHFQRERGSRRRGKRPVVYRWTGRTRIAE